MDPIPPALAAIVAGAGLLAMAIIAALANFGALENLIVRGNAAANAENLIRSADLFRLGAFGLITVAILDILVAWGLYIVFRGINRDLSLLAAWFRLAYGGVFLFSIMHLFTAVRTAPEDPAAALDLIGRFDESWQAGLIVFGIHLIFLEVLLWRTGGFSGLVALLLALAGAGYVIDGTVTLLCLNLTLSVSGYTFIGEIVCIVKENHHLWWWSTS
jgi:hypothetical protein